MTDRTDLELKDTNAGCTCCTPTTSLTADELATASSAVEENILVSGMTCSHCVSSVTEGLAALGGVEDVAIDLNAGGASRVTIHSAAPIDGAAVKAAVEATGYTLAGSPHEHHPLPAPRPA